jgi:hypothetical protein
MIPTTGWHETKLQSAGPACSSCMRVLDNAIAAEVPNQPDAVQPIRTRATWDVVALRQNIARIAVEELQHWRTGGRQRTERETIMLPRLQSYWKHGSGNDFSHAQLSNASFQEKHPWSATFISWVMRQAGAGNFFRRSAKHTVYVAAAKRNRTNGTVNPFHAFRPTEVRPEIGDLVCSPRAGSGVTYDNVSTQSSHCDIVVEVRTGEIVVIGGNARDQASGVSNTVGAKRIRLTPQGYLHNPTAFYAIVKVVPPSGLALSTNPPSSLRRSPSPSQRSNQSGIPSLARTESVPPLRTFYFEINLQAKNADGTTAPTLTGVYLPTSFSLHSPLHVVLYLHGFKGQQNRMAIDQVWSLRRGPAGGLREAVLRAGRNTILIAPTLGTRSDAGWLVTPGGLDRFLSQVMNGIGQHAQINTSLNITSLALACHSGGGRPMRQIATVGNQALSLVRECWAFDSMYNRGDDLFWAQWAARRPGSRMFVYYRRGTQTQALSLSLASQRVSNVQVIASSASSHDTVPVTHLTQRVTELR